MAADTSDQNFDEGYYLETNPDVAASIAAGVYPNAWAHFKAHGQAEGRRAVPVPPLITVRAEFDEAWYLGNNADVTAAVASGVAASGYEHWVASGRAEGRIAPPGYDEGLTIDGDWYRLAYHMVEGEIAAGHAADQAHHHETIGRCRRDLPNRYAPRPDNSAGIGSRFGGLEPDQANGRDLICDRILRCPMSSRDSLAYQRLHGLDRRVLAMGWTRSLVFGLGAWAVSRFVLGLIGVYSFLLDGEPVPWLRMWVQWDANFYLSLIQHGYVLPTIATGLETGQSNLNFFPLLPIGAFLLTPIAGSAVVGGLLFANLSLIAAGVMLHRLVTLRTDHEAADWAVLSLMLLPGSFSMSGIMTEAPFLALSITAAYFADRDRLGTAAAIGSLLTITRLTGVAQGLGFALDWLVARWRHRPASYRRLLWIALMPLPLLALMAFMFYLTGDALVSVHSNFSFWQHEIGFPLENFFMVLWTKQPRLQMQWGIGVIMLAVLLWQWRWFTPGEWLFIGLSIVSFASSESATPSLLRYMIGLYPLHLAMGQVCSRYSAARLLLTALALINGALVIYWVHGRDFYI